MRRELLAQMELPTLSQLNSGFYFGRTTIRNIAPATGGKGVARYSRSKGRVQLLERLNTDFSQSPLA